MRLRRNKLADCSAAAATSCPILECSGSTSTGIPSSSSVSLVVGPIEATTVRASPARTAAARFSFSAMRSMFTTWWLDVNIVTSSSPAANARTFASSGPTSIGQFPAIDLHGLHACTASFEAGHQAGVRQAVFLQADVLLGDLNLLAIDRGQHFAPGVRLGHAIRGLQPQLSEHGDRLRSASDRDDVGDRRQQPLRSTCRSTSASRWRMPTPVMKMMMSIWPVMHVVGKIDRFAILGDRHFAHRGADRGHAAEPLDQTGHLGRAATLEGGDSQSGKS